MFARVMKSKIKLGVMQEAIAEWPEHIAPFKATGLVEAFMLVDRDTGEYMSITLWESKEAQETNVVSVGQLSGRESMTKKYFESPPTASFFEVASVVE